MTPLRRTRHARAGLALLAPLSLLATLAVRPAGAADAARTTDVGQTADAGQTATPGAGPWRIVVLGSSTAAAAGAHPASMGWVSRYATYVKTLHPGNEVINRAVGGYTSYHLMPTGFIPPEGRPQPVADRNITFALDQKPDAILINLPSNDAAMGATVSEQQRNFRVISDLAERAGVPLWVSTTQPRNLSDEKRANQAAMRDWLRETYGVRCMDFWTGLSDADGRLVPSLDSGDGIHINNAGHALAFQRVAMMDIPFQLAWLAPKASSDR